jgi:two-component system, chemotaxis family, protein-glutamate methylesterase/glutaminase
VNHSDAPRVLIAEDDSLLRALLEACLRPHFPDLTLVANGLQAINYLQENQVDVLVTDWLMPEIDGIELIRRVRAESATPPFIIMYTMLGSSEKRAQALQSGADDFLAKPASPAEVRAAIELAGNRQSSSRQLLKAKPVFFPPSAAPTGGRERPPFPVVAIAASTGGPAALLEFFESPSLPTSSVYLVALHGPEWLHQSVVESLRRVSSLVFELAEDGGVPQPGTVYFACKERHLTVSASFRLAFDDSPPEHFLRPAADPMLRSVARSFGRYAVAVVMTGMGHDGAAGCGDIAAAGGVVLAQDPATAVIGSMPHAIIDSGFASEVLPLTALGRAVARHVETLNQALAPTKVKARGLAV